VVAIVASALWQRRFGIGPAEWAYRKFGGSTPAPAADPAPPSVAAVTAPR
jgi:uncharacterized membrane protein YeiB